ncbi:hypothetical protein LTR16_011609, partial [Cryomyces antarcticus]
LPGSASYVAPPNFQTTAFSSYWLKPVATQEPQPALYDPVLNITYPLNLTNPDTIPDNDPDPIYYPEPIANLSTSAANAFIKNIVAQVSEIFEGTSI